MLVAVEVEDKQEALGEILNGDRLVVAPYKINFLIDREPEIICRTRLTRGEVAQFRFAVLKDYFFQMYLDDLPIWGFLGRFDSEDEDNDPSKATTVYLFKHVQFELLYNGDRIIDVIVQSHPDEDTLLDVTIDREVDVGFSYSVKWTQTDIPYEKRLEKYSQASLLQHRLEIHWLSIINSCVTVLLLTGFLATILMRLLRNDFVK